MDSDFLSYYYNSRSHQTYIIIKFSSLYPQIHIRSSDAVINKIDKIAIKFLHLTAMHNINFFKLKKITLYFILATEISLDTYILYL